MWQAKRVVDQKSLCFTDDDDGMSFHTQLLDSYPKLETGGGYDNLMSLL